VDGEINVYDESEGGYMQEQITDFNIEKINDEEIRSYWVSVANHDSITVQVDLEEVMDVHALQVNFQDYRSTIFGRPDTLRQQFEILASVDGDEWETVADFSENTRDMPHAYIELEEPAEARYIRYDHKYLTNDHLAISEFRVFGRGRGEQPQTPANFSVERMEDRRNAMLEWDAVPDATGYVIYWGIEEESLNLSAMIYGEPGYELRALTTDQSYYYQVEAFNENGISERSEVLYTE
jgi:hypothetical protein